MASFIARIAAVCVAAFSLSPHPALAHVGLHDGGDLAAGLMHPLSGLDHLLVMMGIGIVAAQIGGRAVWLVPAAFLTAMTAGGVMGAFGVGVPFVEFGIAVSVVATGAMIATGAAVPTALAAFLTGLFAIFHGYAHRAEMPSGAAGALYGVGFLAATAVLHVAGIGFGLALMRAGGLARLAQAGGGAVSVSGLVLLVRMI